LREVTPTGADVSRGDEKFFKPGGRRVTQGMTTLDGKPNEKKIRAAESQGSELPRCARVRTSQNIGSVGSGIIAPVWWI
jgi:hypothetical protein